MTDDLVRRLREEAAQWAHPNTTIEKQAADRIEELQNMLAKIQHTNLRRDMNIEQRTIEIDRLCGRKFNG